LARPAASWPPAYAFALALRAWGRADDALEVLDHADALTARFQQSEDI
jgi:hypothetical protein